MPYASTSDLPPAVRAKLKPKKQRQWLAVWNSSYDKHKDESRAFAEAWATVQKATGSGDKISQAEASYVDQSPHEDHCAICSMFIAPDGCTLVRGDIVPGGWCKHFDAKVAAAVQKAAGGPMTDNSDNFSFFLPIAKIDETKRTISGYASTEAKDSDGEIVELSAIKAALPDYMTYGNIREMHRLSAIGTAEEAHVDKKGLWLTAKISDDSAWQKVVDKVYKGFSIGGRKVAKVADRITELAMHEISVVDRPANPECRFEIAKMDKSAGIEFAAGWELKKAKKRKAEPPTEPAPSLAAPEQPAGASPAKPTTNDPNDDANLPVKKREYSDEQRADYARSGIALPDGSFPIPDKEALGDAISAYGRAGDKKKAKAHIMSRARTLGAEDQIPEKWTKKAARKAAKIEVRKAAVRTLTVRKSARGSAATPSFLNLKSAGEDRAAARRHNALPVAGLELGRPRKDGPREGGLKKRMSSAGSLAYCFDSLRDTARSLLLEAKAEGGDQKDKALAKQVASAAQILATVIGQKAEHEGQEALDFSDVDDRYVQDILGEDLAMAQDNGDMRKTTALSSDPLGAAILDVVKRAAAPTRAMRMKAAGSNLKKAVKARKAAKAAIEDCHKMLKAAYVAKIEKAAKKKPDPDEDDDFDAPGAMEKLAKAYAELGKVSTFTKAAQMQLKKMASRSGQREQEPSHGNSFYQVPQGVKDLSTSDLATAGPGGEGRGSEPPLQSLDANWAGKLAKAAGPDGKIDARTAALLVENAQLSERNDILTRSSRTAGGQRPFAFDLTKAVGSPAGGGRGDPIMKAISDSGVSPHLLENDDTARGKVIGTYMLDRTNAKSVLDPAFRGTAGIGRG